PSANLENALDRCGTAVFFSATMTPVDYFKRLLGCGESVKTLVLGSPFPPENLCVLIAEGVSTRYRLRDRTKERLARMLASIAGHRRGNYLFFFPSYEYMRMVHEVFASLVTGAEILLQGPGMVEEERERFLDRFRCENPDTLAGFAVMGGIFGEGIDLVGDRLDGAVVVGVGLPGISPENELIRDYFQEKGGSGFDYAYLYPGINRVLQAAGRVIRTGEDRGVVLLIDDRFSSSRYRPLLPGEWRPVRFHTLQDLESILSEFWEGSRRGERG
ncbi:MAG: ATP-dependent DNA helicase, partial [Deltaproteobacteria bacterium]|nr:ATP-dependent DNA helicase [Deltaproteobacteria bacterium]